ncbi:MAG TPA: septum formation initiator family protein [Candidatus Saccharimonadales bacterium]|nr:septum formation initiator family protein [Candidatus Saccharimonadales bacterium]
MKDKIRRILKFTVILIAIILAFSLLRSMSHISSSAQKIEDEKNKVADLEKESEKLKKQLQSVESVQFIEQEARDKLGLAKKGETVVVLPDEETLKSLVPKEETEKEVLPPDNWKLWLNMFL